MRVEFFPKGILRNPHFVHHDNIIRRIIRVHLWLQVHLWLSYYRLAQLVLVYWVEQGQGLADEGVDGLLPVDFRQRDEE